MFSSAESEKIRGDFLVFKKKSSFIYFDNACTTFKPQVVLDAQNEYAIEFPACAGRSSHSWAKLTTQRVEKARRKVADFIGARQAEEIIFTKNATEAINLAAFGLNFESGEIVLTSDKEHNSNLLPWIRLAKGGVIRHKIILTSGENIFNENVFREKLDKNPKIKLIAIVQTSNLDGHIFPVEEIIKIAHQRGILVLLDATQTVPHQKISVKNSDADFLVFSGHKMCGPSGIGVFYGKKELLEKFNPFILGGGTVDNSSYSDYHLMELPDRLEAGIQNYSGILGLEAAIVYLEKIGFKKIGEQEEALNSFITDELSKFPELQIIGPAEAKKRGGIFTFTVKNKDSQEVALLLDNMANIMVRAGQFCVHSWFNARGIKSAVRASFYFYNTMEEAEKFAETMKKIIKL